MRALRSALITPVLALVAVAVQAYPVSGTTAVTSTSTANVALINNVSPTFSFDLGFGQSVVESLLVIRPFPGNGTANYSFTVTDTITFLTPGAGSYSDLGRGSIHVTGDTIDNGGLVWGDGSAGQNVALTGGYVVNLNLSDVSFVGDLPRGGDSEYVRAIFTLVSGPIATVPEPGSAGLAGLALLGAGWARRRQAARRR